MLDRNRRIKAAPEKFQDCKERFDVVVTVEERVYDQVMDFVEAQNNIDSNLPVHVLNIDVEDNHEDATLGAFLISDLISMVRFVLIQLTDKNNVILFLDGEI